MTTQAKREDIERRIGICREYAALWEEFFQFFGTGNFREKKILDQDEMRFGKVLAELARQQFRFCYFMGDKFGDGDKILEVLERTADLKSIQQMTDANFNKLEIDWHTVFINMHRAVGRLTRELPPEEPEDEAGEKRKEKGKGKAKPRKVTVARRPAAPRAGLPAAGLKRDAPGVPKLGVPKGPPGPPRPKGP